MNFNYDNGNNTKSISQLPSQSAHFGLPIRPSHPAGHPTSTPRPGSRPLSSASVTSSPSIVSISPPLTTANTSHVQATNIPKHNHNLAQGPATGTATSVAPTGPPTEFTYIPVSGVISRPHPPHQNHSSNQNQIRNQSSKSHISFLLITGITKVQEFQRTPLKIQIQVPVYHTYHQDLVLSFITLHIPPMVPRQQPLRLC